MIDKHIVESLVDKWLEGREYFLTDLTISADDRIVVEIDHAEGVWIEDCVDLSRAIEAGLDREQEDFELEVGSAGIGQPFKVYRQYEINLGNEVELLTAEGRKLQGRLAEVEPDHVTLEVEQKVKLEGEKRPKLVKTMMPFAFDQIKWCKYLITFK